MRRLIVSLLLFANTALAQNSMLYNNHRKLMIDTSFTISTETYRNIRTIEKVLLPVIFNNIKYPEVARQNGERGTVIVQLTIDNKSMLYTYKIVKSDLEIFNPPVNQLFKNLSKYVRDAICPAGQSINIYIPVRFFLNQDNFEKTLKLNHSVTIEANDTAPQNVITQ
ncbi:energy transducer TonB [Mucilaginibacter sp. L3T2-6]|uniref:energy transducer TonB n=1 Tax=Mucilaginibacter sp. L3T2-6 TaxID=3062491 RepID=UPI002675EC3F|nr:energy transducer TonB [Mucilaginibacter sp. L3T2-6]MDO3644929.1 energy transducer TonB [Mucilaginibacter sp. L3T2-6]MDV6217380.1 energy transducer TonB [Mucilaginibacter sp. L3T2-6]